MWLNFLNDHPILNQHERKEITSILECHAELSHDIATLKTTLVHLEAYQRILLKTLQSVIVSLILVPAAANDRFSQFFDTH